MDDAPSAVPTADGDRSEADSREQRVRALGVLAEHAGDAIFSYDLDGLITAWNRGAEALYGYTADEIVGRSLRLLAGSNDIDSILDRVRGGETLGQHETVRRHKDGSLIDVSLTVAPIRDAAGVVVGAAAVSRDVRERKGLERRLRGLAERDPLTGLFNRRRFEEELERQVAHAERHHRAGALLLLDLDHFKFVNDTFGHGVGDELLRAVGHALCSTVRAGDAVARLGGDEFAVLLVEVDDDGARAAARRLLAAIERDAPPGVPLGASIGAVLFGAAQDGPRGDLIAAADVALTEAKESGRGELAVYSGQARPTLTAAGRLRSAIDDQGLALYAQPIVDLRTGETARHELLLHMLDGDGTPLSPQAFLPTAERYGMLLELDRWVVGHALALATPRRPISINVSGRALDDAAVVEALERHAARAGGGLDVVLAIPETAAIAGSERARGFADRVRALGCRLALDDFGAGFAPFAHLRHLGPDYLKIGAQFVRGVSHSEIDRRILRSIAAIAGAFGIRTVADGADDEATLEWLRDCGIDYARGAHLGSPAPPPASRPV